MDGTAPWAELGLEPGASLAQLKSAFRRRSRELHPDRGGDERAFAALVDAYRTLLPLAGDRATQLPSTSGYANWAAAPATPRVDVRDVDRRRTTARGSAPTTTRDGVDDGAAVFGRFLAQALAA